MPAYGIVVTPGNNADFETGILKKMPIPDEPNPNTGETYTFEEWWDEKLRDYSVRIQHAGMRIKHDEDVRTADLDPNIVEGRPQRP